mmetsp:Transcript_16955/g.56209  ORF Transcript_16955/g.56209 Transcript_16955/m.56209 type:complete len:227 (-) Transcript_16955:673-1353(-)
MTASGMVGMVGRCGAAPPSFCHLSSRESVIAVPRAPTRRGGTSQLGRAPSAEAAAEAAARSRSASLPPPPPPGGGSARTGRAKCTGGGSQCTGGGSLSRRYTLDALSFLRKCSLARTGSYSGGCSSSTQVGSASMTASLCGPVKKGMERRGAAAEALPAGGFITRWTVERHRPLVHTSYKSPMLTTKQPRTGWRACQCPERSLTCSPPAPSSPRSLSSCERSVKPV